MVYYATYLINYILFLLLFLFPLNFMIFNPKASLVPEKISYLRSFAKSSHCRRAVLPVDCCVLSGIDLQHCPSEL